MPYFENPLEEITGLAKTPDPCIMIIFGATGDLTARKLLPALYNLVRENQIPPQFACIGFARRPKTHQQFRNEMREAISQFSRVQPIDQPLWEQFSERLFYHQAEFHDDSGYESLKPLLEEVDAAVGARGNRIYYLSTPSSHFPLIIEKLGQHQLIHPPSQPSPWSRVIIEKPFGHDLASARELQADISRFLDESQIWRIDHWLGKETVQNLFVFRFTNPIFEALWNRQYIDHVQITVAEEIGIGTRGHLWEESGLLRDIVQNHLMQLLALVAMEPPTNLSSEAIRVEKVKVLKALRPFPPKEIDYFAVCGQYGPGYINGEDVKGYRQEKDVAPESTVETYAAMELLIDNWRWSNVPFYLRAGKRLPKRVTEICIAFKQAPGFLYPNPGANWLIIRIQPDEGISLKMNCKVPGLNGPIQPVKMDFRYSSYFGASPPEAYERLLCDCMSNDNTLFAHVDEVIASWQLFTPLLEKWSKEPANFPNYNSGSWGPEEADQLLKRSGRRWRLS